ncbi:MAG: hypothetical protein U5J95_06515 [Balneolaceae bacterium]|nr:hypothetical protein [Balneolaceae bacterium]
MASEEKQYSSEFKAKVAQEALEQGQQNLDGLSEKYDVPVSSILMWSTKLKNNDGDTSIFSDSESHDSEEAHIAEDETVDVEVTDPKIADSFSLGVMGDKMDYRKLVFWSTLGIILIVIFVIALVEMYQYNTQISRDRISEDSEYYEVNMLRKEADETLSSFGVVDLEEGVYRIPIDSVISEMAVDENE